MAKDDVAARIQAAQEGAARRSKSKKKDPTNKYYIAGAIGGSATLFFVYLALTTPTGGSTGKSRGSASQDHAYVTDRSFISGVNSDASGKFTAAASPYFNSWTYADVKWGLDGVSIRGEGMIGMPGAISVCEKEEDVEGGAVPLVYDFTEAHPNCPVEIYDAGNCSSSYAIAAAMSLSTRFCMADAKYKGLKLSPQQILSCDKKSQSCQGGGIDGVWAYLQRRGLYPEECVPFLGDKKGECKTDCAETRKHKSLDYCLMTAGEKAVKREIFNRGPVVAAVHIKDDFLVYEGGVYTPTKYAMDQMTADGKRMVQAAVILGWGKSEEGTKYWLVSMPWGTSWGEKGYARIAIDTVVREHSIIVGTPATDEAVEVHKKKQEEAAARAEEIKAERAAREERIREAKAKRDEEEAAAREAADLTDLDDDDLEDLDLDEEEDKDEV